MVGAVQDAHQSHLASQYDSNNNKMIYIRKDNIAHLNLKITKVTYEFRKYSRMEEEIGVSAKNMKHRPHIKSGISHMSSLTSRQVMDTKSWLAVSV